MPKKPTKKSTNKKQRHLPKVGRHIKNSTKRALNATKPHARKAKHWYRRQSFWRKIGVWIVVTVFTVVTLAYSVSQWYVYRHKNEPLVIGATFIPAYARYFDLNPESTMDAIINDLGIRRFRLVSYWNTIEKSPGKYDFSELDWQFDKVEQAGGAVTLSIGLRQPRWPECHWPEWAQQLPEDQWKSKLKDFMGKVIDRYKDRPILQDYQLENEYFLEVFGECPDHSRERLVDEFNYVKFKDPSRPVIVTRSNNAVPSWPIGEPRADLVGASVYKRVWDRTVTKRYFEYPLPPWFYSFLAGATELTTGRNTFIHEMQTEAWPPTAIKNTSIEEQNKSMPADKLRDRIKYGIDTGMRTIDLWGVEWWYWRKVVLNDPSLWEEGAKAINEFTTSNKQCPKFYQATPNGRSKSPC